MNEVEPSAEPGLRKPGFAEEALPWLDAVYRFSLRLAGGIEEEARDLAQETFLRAYRHWHTYARGTSCRSWLFTICRNAFLRQEERRGRRPEVAESALDYRVEALASTRVLDELRAEDPERRFFDSIVDREITAAVAKLPVEFREAVVLGDLEGLPYADISAVLGVPVGTVKSRIYRGRRLLAAELHDYAREMGYLSGGRQ